MWWDYRTCGGIIFFAVRWYIVQLWGPYRIPFFVYLKFAVMTWRCSETIKYKFCRLRREQEKHSWPYLLHRLPPERCLQPCARDGPLRAEMDMQLLRGESAGLAMWYSYLRHTTDSEILRQTVTLYYLRWHYITCGETILLAVRPYYLEWEYTTCGEITLLAAWVSYLQLWRSYVFLPSQL